MFSSMKTYKRELAIVLLVWLMYLVETKDAEVINILSWPILAAVFGAFGLDFWGKRVQPTQSSGGTNRVRDQRSSQHTVGTDKHTDLGDDK